MSLKVNAVNPKFMLYDFSKNRGAARRLNYSDKMMKVKVYFTIVLWKP